MSMGYIDPPIDKFDNAPPEMRAEFHRHHAMSYADAMTYFRSAEFLQFAKTWGWWFNLNESDHSLMVVDLGIVS